MNFEVIENPGVSVTNLQFVPVPYILLRERGLANLLSEVFKCRDERITVQLVVQA
jgi:hypothetical protein